ncbi:MAG: hypothetical protein RLO04_00930 [Limnobacter sp.]|uniref:hypothetical protein n=1 Tax=Limnobacter sp. TaxID=2003368 RepID=UPI0032EB38C3
MQTALVDTSSLFSTSSSGGSAGMPVNQADKAQFEQMLNEGSGSGGFSNQISSAVSYVENKFNQQHVDIVKNLKSFEESGGAVALMMATHQGANNSVMVQLCGTVSKKCADNAEQIYKQQ